MKSPIRRLCEFETSFAKGRKVKLTGILKFRNDSGIALYSALIVSALFGIALVAFLNLVTWNYRSTMRSQVWNETIPVAEAALEEGLAHLNESGVEGLGTDDWQQSGDYFRMSRILDQGRYSVWISNEAQPVLYAKGEVKSPLTDSWIPRAVRVTTQSLPLFFKGLVAKDTFDLRGNNIETDSFDSKDPAFSSGGQYVPSKSKAGGDVATNSRIIDSLSIGNAKIRGRISSGPEASPAIGPNGVVGSMEWHAAGNKGIQPGWYSDDMNVDFPEVDQPSMYGWYPTPAVVDGVYYDYALFNTKYSLTDLRLTGSQKLLVRGNATLIVNRTIDLSGLSSIIIAEGASLDLYMNGESATIAGKGVVNKTGNALNFQYWGTKNNKSIKLSGNAGFIGTIYALNAALQLGGGGSDIIDFVGAGVADSITMNGHYRFHYDENLREDGPKRGWVASSWNEIQVSQLPGYLPSELPLVY